MTRYPKLVVESLAAFDAARGETLRRRRELAKHKCAFVAEDRGSAVCYVHLVNENDWCAACVARQPFYSLWKTAHDEEKRLRRNFLRNLDSLRVEPKRKVNKVRRLARQVFADYIQPIRDVAGELGYAVAVHGSLERDLDLVCVPWQHDAAKPEVLAVAIRDLVGGYFKSEGDELRRPRRVPLDSWNSIIVVPKDGVATYFDLLIVEKDAKIAATKKRFNRDHRARTAKEKGSCGGSA